MPKDDEIRPTAPDGETASFVVRGFLGVLARDIEDYPERVKPIDPSLAARIAAAAQGVDSDAVTYIVGEVAL